MAPTVPAVIRPMAGVVVLLAATAVVAALPVAPVVSDLFFGTHVPAAARVDSSASGVKSQNTMRQSAAASPSPTPDIWDDYGGTPPPLVGDVLNIPADVLMPTEEALPDATDSGDSGGDASTSTEEPIWDDYGGGSPYPPVFDGFEDDGPLDDEGMELQDPPVAASLLVGGACVDLGAVCHRLVRCCGEEIGTAVCAAAADETDEHPSMGHCMRTVGA
ncbi:hypothetical protein MMPV_006394 [Pyropia vietnamensis]